MEARRRRLEPDPAHAARQAYAAEDRPLETMIFKERHMTDRRIPILLALRLGIFILFAAWTVDKFVRPEHAAQIAEKFYLMKGWGHGAVFAIAAAESALLLAFVLGLGKRLTYGAVLVPHGISTLSAFRQYAAPFQGPNLLFFAAWPALAACLALYLLRDLDTLVAGGRAR